MTSRKVPKKHQPVRVPRRRAIKPQALFLNGKPQAFLSCVARPGPDDEWRVAWDMKFKRSRELDMVLMNVQMGMYFEVQIFRQRGPSLAGIGVIQSADISRVRREKPIVRFEWVGSFMAIE